MYALIKAFEIKTHTTISCIKPISRHCNKSIDYCYDTGILAFLSILIVIIRKSGTLRIKVTIRTEKPPWCAAYCYNTEETKGREIPVSYNNTEKIFGFCLTIEFHY